MRQHCSEQANFLFSSLSVGFSISLEVKWILTRDIIIYIVAFPNPAMPIEIISIYYFLIFKFRYLHQNYLFMVK